jgi:sugar phosphate isomerase/epimerase
MPDVPRIAAALSLDGLPGDARAAFDLAAQAGYTGVAIPTNHAELSPDRLGESARRHLRKTLESRHLALAAIRAAAPRNGLTDPATIDRTVENVRKAVTLAGELGVKTVSLFAGPLTSPTGGEAGVVAALKELAQAADRAGVTLAVSADATEKLLPLLEQVAYENAAMNLAPALAVGTGEDPLKVVEALANRRGGVAALTAADAVRAGARVRAAELGEGQVPWAELLDLLREQDFRGPTVVDVRDLPNGPDAARHAAAVLRKLLPVRAG